ncbi:DUF4180 domain-containing protein [Streptomyces atratus]|uniref:DUF4180 domain-containing protein n=1 Tax=Streptomyces atratus TaxID=1893 RepID=UPI0016713510|nr:DUF4180 domain-containing protein [Streptomyces atratus]WPW26477.1 DUF4180 domain-containing protein [Streptomyces atratus]GGT77746.1 hypothetical protein GCM10010207_87550 [Streptomyces atratus]
MPDTLHHLAGTPVLVCVSDGAPLRDEHDATDLISEGHRHGAAWAAIPEGRLPDDFFHLRARVVGSIVQKFVNYRLGLAIVGDISRYTDASPALQDFVPGSNRGTQLWENRALLRRAGR